MGFMQIETMQDVWYQIETRDGTDYVPASVCGSLGLENGQSVDEESPEWQDLLERVHDYVEGHEISEICCIGKKWAARYSAPGYMDCTHWCLGETEADARSKAIGIYGDE